jgi:hypothetical protein
MGNIFGLLVILGVAVEYGVVRRCESAGTRWPRR